METKQTDIFNPFQSPQLQGGIIGIFLTYLTCSLVTMASRQFIRNKTYKAAILASARTINFLSWSIILFFMSLHIPLVYTQAILALQIACVIWIFDEAPFSPCGVYGVFLENHITARQTFVTLILQFITAPIGILLADFYLYHFFTDSHTWVGWIAQYKEAPIKFMNVSFVQAFIIEMFAPALINLTSYVTKNHIIYTALVCSEVVLLNVLCATRTGFFINPLNATVFMLMYGIGWSYFELFIVYWIAPMLGTWLAVGLIGNRLVKEKEKLP